MISKSQKKRVNAVVEAEGFDYTFRQYSNFSEVNDKKFHELRLAYIAAAKALESCLSDESDV